jgi:hypothetical protein
MHFVYITNSFMSVENAIQYDFALFCKSMPYSNIVRPQKPAEKARDKRGAVYISPFYAVYAF